MSAAEIVQTISASKIAAFVDRDPKTSLETALETVSADNSMPPQRISANSIPRLRQTPFRRRLPRFVRAKRSHRPPIALQERDLELLRTAHEYRLVSTPQYLKLFADESRDGVYRRLQRLFHHGYLDRIGSNPNAPLVYGLGRRGAEVLEVSVPKQAGQQYVAHRLMIGDFRICMTHATRERAIEFCWRPVRPNLPVRPDGFFSLRFATLPDGRNTAHFFLEADRSTMTRERFIEKLRAYASWAAVSGHTEALGIRHFRVLTVTKSEARLVGIVAAVAAVADLRGAHASQWFTSVPRVEAPDGPFGVIWQTPDDPEYPKTLLPPDVAGFRPGRPGVHPSDGVNISDTAGNLRSRAPSGAEKRTGLG